MSFTEFMRQAADDFGISLSESQVMAFGTYYNLLLDWNSKINLTAITDPKEVAVKHMVDSLSCLDENVLPVGCSLIDVGTGAGFPGLPLKILRPDIKLTLLDSLNKRLLFLKEVVQQLALTDVTFIHGRAEDLGQSKLHRERYDAASARAVARLNILCELCLPFVKNYGYFIALKGAQYKEELQEAQRAMQVLGAKQDQVKTVALPGLEDVRAVIYIQKVQMTPAAYPRRPGTPEKKPL